MKDEGLANACAVAGIPCWGPPKEAAQLEASKEFAKEFMVRQSIPTGGYSPVETIEEARAAIDGKYPTVLKFDGLAAGKGVAVCMTEGDAEEFLDEVLVQQKFGPGRLLVEEYLEGPEISIFASVVDGDYQILAPARDYKRIYDADEGPNTGGMGAVSSLDMFEGDLRSVIDETIVRPTVVGLQNEFLPYRGFLYFGLIPKPRRFCRWSKVISRLMCLKGPKGASIPTWSASRTVGASASCLPQRDIRPVPAVVM